MSDDFNAISDALYTVLMADATLTALLGKHYLDSGAVAGALTTAIATSLTYTGTAPAINDVWKIEDELVTITALTGGGSPATITRGTAGTVAAAHVTGQTAYKYLPSIIEDPPDDLSKYPQAELPLVAFTCENSDPDQYDTIRLFNKPYHFYLEVVGCSTDRAANRRVVRHIMSQVRSVLRVEKDSGTPLGGVATDMDVGAAQAGSSKGSSGMHIYWMYMSARIELRAES